MTRKIAVSLPDDVAERLSHEGNVSAYVAEAVRRRMASERTREIMRAIGFQVSEEDVARAREESERLRAAITPELRAQAARLYAEVMGQRQGTAHA